MQFVLFSTPQSTVRSILVTQFGGDILIFRKKKQNTMQPELHQRWFNSKCAVVGCSYNIEEIAYWTQFDNCYIAIGMGQTVFKDDPFNADWATTLGFWENDVVQPYYGQFNTVYLDRCVWNCFQDTAVFVRMLKFVAKLLKRGGRFYIPTQNWNEAVRYKLARMFHDVPPHGGGSGGGYEITDVAKVDAMIKTKLFRLGSTVTYERGKASHRYEWQVFYKK